MNKIIKNPLFRISGVLVILYYGLFYNNNHPDSLKKRLETQKIKSNLQDISVKSSNIFLNIKEAEEIKKSYNHDSEKGQKEKKL